MKNKLCLASFLMCILFAGIQLHAQQVDDAQDSFRVIKANAENGDYEAQNILGVCYETGKGTSKNDESAVKWYRKAAENGNAGAQLNLGRMYSLGLGVPKNSEAGVKWFRKSADQGIAQAQAMLGKVYEYGDGVSKDLSEAVKWYRKAADQGCEMAQFELGVRYEHGEGVKKDAIEEVKWYRRSAERGYAMAQFNLGCCYGKGEGVEKDVVEAVKWFRVAAEQNLARAQYSLGGCYYVGMGVKIDYTESYKWNVLAADQGNTDAVNRLNSVFRENLTPEQIAEGQRRAAAFVPRKVIDRNEFSSPAETTLSANPSCTGTGFFITDDGFLVSNYHVVKDAAKVRLITGAGLIDAKVTKIDAANDLALLKADGKFTSLPVAASRTVKLGGTVATVGFPDTGLQGFSPKLAKGEIASLAGIQDDPRYFQISVPVQPGNSGGALVDARGNVVGIVAAKLNAKAALDASGALPENVNYAVKSSLLLSFLESVPNVSAKLKEPLTADRKFEDVVTSAQDAAVLVVVY